MRQIDNPLVKKKYDSTRWEKLREEKLASVNYLCERCLKKHIYVPAKIVHHKEYVTQENYTNDDVFFNIDNLEALCAKCHLQEHFASDDNEYEFDEEGNVVWKKE